MLVLTRKQGQAIQIDDAVTIEILAISKNQVRLGFKAPESVSIYREEIYSRIKNDKQPGEPLVIELPLAVNQD